MISDLGAGLGGVALFAASGLGLSELTPCLRRLPLAPRLGYSYPLGLAAVAGVLYGLSHFLSVPLRAPAVWSVAALAALAGAAAKWARRSSPELGSRQPHGRPPLWRTCGPLPLACALIAGLVVLGVMAEALTGPVRDWDGRMTWCTQARYIRAAGTVDAPVLRDGRWFVSHPQYPLLLPVAQVAVLEAFGRSDDSPAPRALYAACLGSLLLIIFDGARRYGSAPAGGLLTLAAAAIPFVAFGEGGALSAYSDLPLACFFGAALVLMESTATAGAGGIAAGLFLGAAVLTKNEGLILALLLLALGSRRVLWPSGVKRSRAFRDLGRDLAVAGLFVFAAGALLLSWRAGIPNREDEDYLALVRQSGHLSGALGQLPAVVEVLLGKMFSWRHWTSFWWMIPALWLAGWRGLARAKSLPVVAAAAGPPLVGCLAYAVHWRSADLASVSWERFLVQALVPVMLVTALALQEVLHRTRWLHLPAWCTAAPAGALPVASPHPGAVHGASTGQDG